jgi:hypothetical protein
VCFFSLKNLRCNISLNFVAILLFFDLGNCLFSSIPIAYFIKKNSVCFAFSFLENTFTTGEIIWVNVLSVYSYKRLYLNYSSDCIKISKAFIITTLCSISASILSNVLGMYLEKSPKINYFCDYSVKDNYLEFFLFYFLFTYLLVFLTFFFNMFLIFKISRKFKNLQHQIKDPLLSRLKIFPFIIFFSYLSMFILRCMQINSNFNLWIHSILLGISDLIGFFNFLVLGLTKEFKRGFFFEIGKEIPLSEL